MYELHTLKETDLFELNSLPFRFDFLIISIGSGCIILQLELVIPRDISILLLSICSDCFVNVIAFRFKFILNNSCNDLNNLLYFLLDKFLLWLILINLKIKKRKPINKFNSININIDNLNM